VPIWRPNRLLRLAGSGLHNRLLCTHRLGQLAAGWLVLGWRLSSCGERVLIAGRRTRRRLVLVPGLRREQLA
jgi:hypothetical protein